MGKLVSTFFMSLDGVVESPHTFHFPYFDARMGALMAAYQQQIGAYLMGRELYSQWSQFWPGNTSDDFGAFINPLPKYVLSNSLTEAAWENTELITGDEDAVAARVGEVKAATDGDVGMSGCATTVRWLLGRGLVEELVLFVDPVLVGTGARLLEDPAAPVSLELIGQETLATGVHHLRYLPTPTPPG